MLAMIATQLSKNKKKHNNHNETVSIDDNTIQQDKEQVQEQAPRQQVAVETVEDKDKDQEQDEAQEQDQDEDQEEQPHRTRIGTESKPGPRHDPCANNRCDNAEEEFPTSCTNFTLGEEFEHDDKAAITSQSLCAFWYQWHDSQTWQCHS